jgi:hypothetical protein
MGDCPPICRVLDITIGSPAVIVGTIYAEVPFKPNVLNDLEGDVSAKRRCVDFTLWFLARIALDKGS